MKFPVSWLREWVETDLDAEEIGRRITIAGLEVDGLESEGDGLNDVIVAEVVKAERHPDADRLSVCQVRTDSDELIEVVCGAPNVRDGLKTAFAGPGVRLPNGMKLRRSKIRGVVSNGMLCSAQELGLGADADGIMDLPADAPVGSALTEYLGLPDTIIDIDITPNRGDCFSVMGVARDVAALTGVALTGPELKAPKTNTDAVHPVERPVPEACPRFAHCVVEGVDLSARTPLWMTERLRRSGLRAIHPIVDVTNYVMLELGQPLHSYDRDKLNGAVAPRISTAGESLELLDGSSVNLDDRTVVITDDSGVIGLAGIMGGLSTMVTEETRNVFFEGAFWPPSVMAGRARSYGMHTDASVRFERGVDPEGQARAVARAAELLQRIAGGQAGPVVDDFDAELIPPRPAVELTATRLRQVLGTDLPTETVTSILQGLGLDVVVETERWKVTPPPHRFDIEIEDDLVEEVARIYGYDKIPEATGHAELPLEPIREAQVATEAVAELLVARDYSEVITYSFVEQTADERVNGEANSLQLSNPLSSEMGVMRSTLWPGLFTAAEANVARQQGRVRLFEVGKTYHGNVDSPHEVERVAGLIIGDRVPEQWGTGSEAVDFFDIKGDVEALLDATGCADEFSFIPAEHPTLQPGQAAAITRNGERVGWLGKVHPVVARDFDLKPATFVFELDVAAAFEGSVPKAEPVSRYPEVRRDIAVLVDESVSAAALAHAVRDASPGLIRDVRIFDVYRGSAVETGLKSVALGLILQETSRTLTDDDADAAVAAAVQKIRQDFDANLRD